MLNFSIDFLMVHAKKNCQITNIINKLQNPLFYNLKNKIILINPIYDMGYINFSNCKISDKFETKFAIGKITNEKQVLYFGNGIPKCNVLEML